MRINLTEDEFDKLSFKEKMKLHSKADNLFFWSGDWDSGIHIGNSKPKRRMRIKL